MNDSAQEESKSRIEAEQASQKRDSVKRAQTEDIQPSREFGVRNRRGGVDGDELDEIKEEHSDRQDKDEKVGEL